MRSGVLSIGSARSPSVWVSRTTLLTRAICKFAGPMLFIASIDRGCNKALSAMTSEDQKLI